MECRFGSGRNHRDGRACKALAARLGILAVATVLVAASRVDAQSYALVPVNGGGASLDPYATTNGGPGPTQWNLPVQFRTAGFPTLNLNQFMPAAPRMNDRLWLRAEYLHWWTSGMDTPPLVTTSPTGTAAADSGVLGVAGTQTLFGGDINDGSTPGGRIQAGLFLTPSAAFGIQGEYFRLGSQEDGFDSGSRSIVARPFYDISRALETAQIIRHPDVTNGTLRIRSDSDLHSFMLAGRAALCPTCGGNCVTCQNTDRVDWLVGFRHLRLEDGLSFHENITSTDLAAPGTIALQESFSTENEFNGLQLGVVYQANLQRVWLESALRVAIGQNKQHLRIRGTTDITEFDDTISYPGGILAQTTNIGSREREQFTMVPEIGVTLGVRLWKNLHGTIGYSLLYFPSVVRAGSQIDTDVNSSLFPPPLDPIVGAPRPEFRYVESDFYAHGLSVGAQLQF